MKLHSFAMDLLWMCMDLQRHRMDWYGFCIDLYAFVWGIQMKTEDFHHHITNAEKKGMQRVRDAVGGLPNPVEGLRRSKRCTCL